MTVVGPDGTHFAADSLRGIEHASIRRFVQQAADDGYLSGRVLDYGCGKQPYRDIVEAAGGEYVGYDRRRFPANVSKEDVGVVESIYDIRPETILCTQVIQYVPIEQDTDLGDGLQGLLSHFASGLVHYDPADDPPRKPRYRGNLVLTYPTNWPEVEPEDLHRFTKAGMERLLTEAGFEIVRHEQRARIAPWASLRDGTSGDFFALGYGVIARA